MEALQTYIHGTTLQNFAEVLYLMANPESQNKEMLFSTDMIDQFCEEGKYSRYVFGYNFLHHVYWRMTFNNIFLEYVVIPEIRKQDYNAHVFKIFHNSQCIYTRPIKPQETIHVVWPNTEE